MIHEKIDPETVDMSEFIFSPKKTTLIGNNHELLYSKQSFFIQSPVCQVLNIDPENNTMKLQFFKEDDSTSYQLFCDLNGLFFRYLKEEYPGVKFINTVHCGHIITITAKLSPNVLFFDSNKDIIISKDIKEGDHILALVKTKGLWVSEDTGTMKWSAFQILKM